MICINKTNYNRHRFFFKKIELYIQIFYIYIYIYSHIDWGGDEQM